VRWHWLARRETLGLVGTAYGEYGRGNPELGVVVSCYRFTGSIGSETLFFPRATRLSSSNFVNQSASIPTPRFRFLFLSRPVGWLGLSARRGPSVPGFHRSLFPGTPGSSLSCAYLILAEPALVTSVRYRVRVALIHDDDARGVISVAIGREFEGQS